MVSLASSGLSRAQRTVRSEAQAGHLRGVECDEQVSFLRNREMAHVIQGWQEQGYAEKQRHDVLGPAGRSSWGYGRDIS